MSSTVETSVCQCGRAATADAEYCRYCGSLLTRRAVEPGPAPRVPVEEDQLEYSNDHEYSSEAPVAVPAERQGAIRLPVPGVAVVAVVAAVAVIGAAVLVLGGRTSHAPGNAARAAALPALAGRPSAGSPLEPEVRALTAWVEGARGLHFKRPVTVRLLDDAAVKAQARRLADIVQQKGNAAEQVLRAVGAVPTDVDLATATDALTKTGADAAYDPASHVLALADRPLSPVGRAAVVRELARALDDQHFDIHRPELGRGSDERALAFSALVDGDAARLREAFVAGLPQPERDQIAGAGAAAVGALGQVPTALRELLAFPYDAGTPFVQSLVTSGGQAALDRAFGRPPVTTEQVLHVERYAAGEGARRVAAPPAREGVRPIATGSIGELGLRLLFEAVADPGRASAAAAGWGGDRLVAWRADFKTCIAANVVMDSGADRAELVDALNRWDGRQAESSVEAAGDAVTVRACR